MQRTGEVLCGSEHHKARGKPGSESGQALCIVFTAISGSSPSSMKGSAPAGAGASAICKDCIES